jgi:hypothetical protein
LDGDPDSNDCLKFILDEDPDSDDLRKVPILDEDPDADDLRKVSWMRIQMLMTLERYLG